MYSADEVLSPYVYVFFAAFFVAYCYTPLMRRIAIYFNIIDQPDLVRKMHHRPVAYLGGVAVFLGWLAGLGLSQFLFLHRTAPGLPEHVVLNFSIVAGAILIVILGLWDDTRKISPRLKIAGQGFAAVILLCDGVGTHWTQHLLGPISVRMNLWLGWPSGPYFPEWIIVATSCAMTIAIVVFCCNATNLMDGLDGLCGGVTGIIAFGFVVLAVHLGRLSTGITTNADAARVVLGSRCWVRYSDSCPSISIPHRYSWVIREACSWDSPAVMIVLMAEAGSKWFLAAGVMFAHSGAGYEPGIRGRYVNRRPFFSADKYHFHHQLVARGLSVRKAVLLAYVLAIGFVLLGTAIVFMRTRYAVGAYIVIFAYIVVAAYKLGMVHERPIVVSETKALNQEDVLAASPTDLDADSVLEIRDQPRARAAGACLVRPEVEFAVRRVENDGMTLLSITAAPCRTFGPLLWYIPCPASGPRRLLSGRKAKEMLWM